MSEKGDAALNAESREQSQEWYEGENVLEAADLGPYRILVTADFTIDDEGFADVPSNTAHLTLTNTEKNEVLIDEDVHALDGVRFTTLDSDLWYIRAEQAIVASGEDLDALIAQYGQNANAA